jgi:hypothetical protein
MKGEHMNFLKRNWILILGILFVIICMPLIGRSQDFLVPDYVFGGVAVDKELDAPAAFPFVGFAYKINGSEKTLSFTSADFTPYNIELGEEGNTFLGQRFQITARTGFAQQLFKIKAVSVYALGDVGILRTGGVTTSSVGWGGFVRTRINGWCGALVILQAERSPLLGTDLKPRFGIDFNINALMDE